MKRLTITALTSTMIYGPATAQDVAQHASRDVVLELTMTLIPANAQNTAAVTAPIEVPEKLRRDTIANTQGVEQRARGLETADLDREGGRALGEAAAAVARDNRESASRASRKDGNQGLPATPKPPDRPVPSP